MSRFYPTGSVKEQKVVTDALSGSSELVRQIGDYFYTTTKKLLDGGSFTLVGGKTKGVDLVRRVLRLAPVTWLANLVRSEADSKSKIFGCSHHSADRNLLEVLP